MKLAGIALAALGSVVFVLAAPVAAAAACATPEAAFIFGLGPISKVTANSAELQGGVDPKGCETSWRFEYSTSLTKLESGEGTVVAGGATIGAGEADNKFHATVSVATGLQAGTLYFVRLFAENVEGGKAEEEPLAFETRGKPAAVTFAAHAIDGEEIRALGTVAPNGLDTHYRVQYVTQQQFEETGWAGAGETPELDAGAGSESRHPIATKGIKTWPRSIEALTFGSQVVGADMPGMQAGEVYRYRMVASNEQGVGVGGEQTLIVPGVGSIEAPPCENDQFRTGPSAGLPDCRAYEQVTPADKQGAEDTFSYASTFKTGARVAEDGEHVTVSQTGLQWGSTPDPTKGNYFFTRTPTGWQTASARPAGEAGPLSYQATLFGPDLTDLGVEASWSTGEAVQSQSPDIEYMTGPAGGPYTSVPPVPRKQVGSDGGWVAASANLGKMILQVEDHTLLGSTGTSSGYDIYEYSEGQLRQANAGIGSCGAHMVEGVEGYPGHFGDEGFSSDHAVSADGSRVFFEATPGSKCSEPAHLYVRTNGMKTTDLGIYKFVAASADGTSVLLERDEGGTFEYGVYSMTAGTTTRLFATQEPMSGQGQMVVSSAFSGESGGIYFFSSGSLTPEAPGLSVHYEDSGVAPRNLYHYDLAARQLKFVAQVGGEVQSGGGFSVSPDGRYFYFTSSGVAAVAPPKRENANSINFRAYRYDSLENVVQCMSCASTFDPAPSGQATFLPASILSSADAVPDLRVASDNGDYVFFDTTAPLLLQDIDGEIEAGTYGLSEGNHNFYFSVSSDVYEWRKAGVDNCAHVQGCLALISSGAGGLRNTLLGTTPSGRDVFFATHSALVGQDDDTAGDVYDARIGGGFPPPPTRPVECEENACQRPLIAPIDTTPASLAFSGPGNPVPVVAAGKVKIKPKPKLKACRAGTVRRGSRCVKRKHAAKSTARGAVRHNRGRGK
ncbi:MAG TPA: hypothetical protein VG053_07430 [Solirubrobacteraceae bacterium]|nr:hypothetical protein [Solirubrobacteraceae bacterium]